MPSHKKISWSQPFKQISTKIEFEQLKPFDKNYNNTLNQNNQSNQVEKKIQKLFPRIQLIAEKIQTKKVIQLTPNYIRHVPLLNHEAQIYQLTQVDYTFIQIHQHRFYYKDKTVLTDELLKKCIIQLQLKAGKSMILPQNKNWIIIFLENQYKQLVQMNLFDQFCQIIYQYWKNRRKELKYPLLKQLWKPNLGQFDVNIAYHPRDREKRYSRKKYRNQQKKIIKQLSQEFQLASKITDRIQIREELKLKKVITLLNQFYQQCSPFLSLPEYIQDAKNKDRILFQGNYKDLANKRLLLLNLKQNLSKDFKQENEQDYNLQQQ